MHPCTKQIMAKRANLALSKLPKATNCRVTSPSILSNERFEVEDDIQIHLGSLTEVGYHLEVFAYMKEKKIDLRVLHSHGKISNYHIVGSPYL